MSKVLSIHGTNAKKVTQAFAGVAVLTLAAGGGTIFWMNGHISMERAHQTKLQAQVGSSEEVARRLQTTEAAYNDTRSRISFLEATVTEKSYVPTLLQQLQALATDTNLSVTSVQPSQITQPAAPASSGSSSGSGSSSNSGSSSKKTAPPPYDTMDVDLHVTGTYADTARFLYGLTHFPKVVSVISVQMSPGTSGTTPQTTVPQVSTDLKLTAFVFHDNGDTNSSADSTPSGTVQTAGAVVPPPTAPTLTGAADRAARGAIGATEAANAHATTAAKTL